MHFNQNEEYFVKVHRIILALKLIESISLATQLFVFLEERKLFASVTKNGGLNMTQRYLTGCDVLLDRRANKVTISIHDLRK